MSIHLDLTELVANPLRSGIQRVEREAIRHWPGPTPLVPCLVAPDGQLRRLPSEVLACLCQVDDGSPQARSAERAELQRLAGLSEALDDGAVRRLLNLELFFGDVRADTHLRLAAQGVEVMWYVYDFLPFLRPDLFPPGTTRHCMHYVRALHGVGDRIAFLSEATRTDFLTRISRGKRPRVARPVIDPGADGLELERQFFSPKRRSFVSIGTIERRKNTGALLRAFAQLWAEGVDAPLVIAGRLDPGAREAQAFFAEHAGNPRFTYLDQPSDHVLRQLLRGARAVVMPSEAEGFGLPPYEALHAGIPVIASSALPCAPLLRAGALLLDRMEAGTIAEAARWLCDDAQAAGMWQEASTVQLPSWANFGKALGDWAQAP
jgi:glycosyltransferase involved in cell wall biosynthesis